MGTGAKKNGEATDQVTPVEAARPSAAPDDRPFELIDMIWPETGLQTTTRVPRQPKDALTEDDELQLQIDFLTLTLSPLEFIQLAAFLRMSIDGLLELHPGLQRAVVNAFDIRD